MEVLGKIKLLNGVELKIKGLISGIMDIVMPPTAAYPVADPTNDSVNPWQNLTFLDEPCCQACGYPFEYNMGSDPLCVRCMVDRPVFDQARSALQYHVDSSGLILSFKHGGRTQNLDRFARQMVRAGRPFWKDADIIIPVPLHKSKLRKRRFNQAGLLARAVSDHINIPFDPHSLIRHKETVSQGNQTAKGRFRNVQGAFSIPEDRTSLIADRNIVLIDDVYTTGATLEACTRTLRRAGAAHIYALTLARVVRDQEIPT